MELLRASSAAELDCGGGSSTIERGFVTTKHGSHVPHHWRAGAPPQPVDPAPLTLLPHHRSWIRHHQAGGEWIRSSPRHRAGGERIRPSPRHRAGGAWIRPSPTVNESEERGSSERASPAGTATVGAHSGGGRCALPATEASVLLAVEARTRLVTNVAQRAMAGTDPANGLRNGITGGLVDFFYFFNRLTEAGVPRCPPRLID